MLRQLSQEVETAAPEQLRVTAEELTEAMAAIEARRTAEQRERERTIALGEAIRELGLDASPEELAEAVALVRAKRRQAAAAPPRHVPSRRRLRTLGLALLSLWAGLFWMRATIGARLVARAPEATIAVPAPPPSPAPVNATDYDFDGRVKVVNSR